jgi:hypothetical protein
MQQFVTVAERLTQDPVRQALAATTTGHHLIAETDTLTTLDTSGSLQASKAGPLSRWPVKISTSGQSGLFNLYLLNLLYQKEQKKDI